jgi:hypothetical protein
VVNTDGDYYTGVPPGTYERDGDDPTPIVRTVVIYVRVNNDELSQLLRDATWSRRMRA